MQLQQLATTWSITASRVHGGRQELEKRATVLEIEKTASHAATMSEQLQKKKTASPATGETAVIAGTRSATSSPRVKMRAMPSRITRSPGTAPGEQFKRRKVTARRPRTNSSPAAHIVSVDASGDKK